MVGYSETADLGQLAKNPHSTQNARLGILSDNACLSKPPSTTDGTQLPKSRCAHRQTARKFV